MWPFWLMYLIPTVAAISSPQIRSTQQRFAWRAVAVFFVLLIGFRDQVGGDWYNYLAQFKTILYYSFNETLSRGDPGYYAINWLVANQGWSIYWVNVVCAVIVMWGVSTFARSQPLPWLALTAAVPYLLIVVAMGYTRQAAALGFALVGLTALGQHKLRQFVFL